MILESKEISNTALKFEGVLQMKRIVLDRAVNNGDYLIFRLFNSKKEMKFQKQFFMSEYTHPSWFNLCVFDFDFFLLADEIQVNYFSNDNAKARIFYLTNK